jgi:RNA polymerase sigma factor (sigma-70 family)
MERDDRSDGQLLSEFNSTHAEGAFEALVQRHGPLVFGVCYRVLGRTHEAEDAAQAVFLTLAVKAGSLRPDSLAGWLYKVARQVALNIRKANTVRMQHENSQEPIQTRDPQQAANKEMRAALDRELLALPERYRVPILLHHLEGRTKDEVAAELGVNSGTVSSRLDRGRELLRERLGRAAVSFSVPALLTLVGQETVAIEVPRAFTSAAGKHARLIATGSAAGAQAVPARARELSSKAMEYLAAERTRSLLKISAAACLLIALLGAGVSVAERKASPEGNASNASHVPLDSADSVDRRGALQTNGANENDSHPSHAADGGKPSGLFHEQKRSMSAAVSTMDEETAKQVASRTVAAAKADLPRQVMMWNEIRLNTLPAGLSDDAVKTAESLGCTIDTAYGDTKVPSESRGYVFSNSRKFYKSNGTGEQPFQVMVTKSSNKFVELMEFHIGAIEKTTDVHLLALTDSAGKVIRTWESNLPASILPEAVKRAAREQLDNPSGVFISRTTAGKDAIYAFRAASNDKPPLVVNADGTLVTLPKIQDAKP